LDTIYNEGKRAADLTAQILDFARQTVMDRRPLDLLPFLEDFVDLLQRTLADNIEVVFEYDGDGYVVMADSSRIQQALMNLALNSRDAMPGGGRILIRLIRVEFDSVEQVPIPDAAGEWVRIMILDNGSGISDEALNHLFEPFYTTKEPGKGTGLGLAQVYGIVKQHHGFVGVESELGKGTTIGITLPVTVDGQPGDNRPLPDSIKMGNGELILVVEDNHATRLALMSALESLNYPVKGAEDGLEALTLLQRHQYEFVLVLSDVVMPEMGGVALLEAMAAEGFEIPAVLLTGNSTAEELDLVKAEGRVEWYSKPIPLEMLGEIVAGKIGGL
jgi:CheY-like chemotaxis protein